MPKSFERCRENGGKIRTLSGPNKLYNLGKNQYCHICILKGKVYRGETKTKESKK